jgi:hypothetical protein
VSGLRISVHGSKELQALTLRLKGLDKKLASQINKATRNVAEPIWQEAVGARVSDRLESRVLANTARVSVSRSNVTLRAGAIGRTLTGGAKPPDLVHAVEFGANREGYTTYGRISPGSGQEHSIKRRTRRQFRPRQPKGYVVYPAAEEVIPRMASLWAQTSVRTLHETIEG